MRVSSQMLADTVIRNLRTQTKEILKYQKRIASGKKIHLPSDSPPSMRNIFEYRKIISKLDQYNRNIVKGRNRTAFSEGILGAIQDLMKDAEKLAGSNPNLQNASEVGQLVDDVRSIRTQIRELANSKYQGNYLFAGHQSDTPPFDAAFAYQGDTGNMNYLIGDGMQVTINADGSDIFQGVEDVFDSLNDLETGLLTLDINVIETQIQRLYDAGQKVQLVRSENALKQKRMEATEEHWDKFKLDLETLLSSEQDADIAESAVMMKVLETSYEVSLASSAKIIQPTLIQFIS